MLRLHCHDVGERALVVRAQVLIVRAVQDGIVSVVSHDERHSQSTPCAKKALHVGKGLGRNFWPAEYFSIYHQPDGYFEVAARTSQDENALLPSW